MAEHLSNGTDQNHKTITQLERELAKAKRRCLTLYDLCENSVETTEKLHQRCIQSENNLKAMMGMLLFSALINGILLGIGFRIIQKAPENSTTIFIPEHMMPHIHEIG